MIMPLICTLFALSLGLVCTILNPACSQERSCRSHGPGRTQLDPQTIYDYSDMFHDPTLLTTCEQELATDEDNLFLTNQVALLYLASDKIESAEILLRSNIDKGDAFANYLLASCLLYNVCRGEPNDSVVTYFMSAAERGLPYAAIFASDLKHDGILVDGTVLWEAPRVRDADIAYQLLIDFDTLGFPYGRAALGEILMDSASSYYNLQVGIELIQSAALDGHFASAIKLITWDIRTTMAIDREVVETVFCQLPSELQRIYRDFGASYECLD